MAVELAGLPTAAAWLATFAAVLLFGRHLRHRRYNLPPGPRSWTIIGNLNLIGPLPHRSIHALSQKYLNLIGPLPHPSIHALSQKYGPIIHLWFGSKLVVVGSSVELAREFLKTHDAALAGRPKFAAGKYTTYNYSDITWSQYGPYWRQARKMCLTQLFSAKRLESYEYVRREELKDFLKELYDSADKAIVLKDHLSTQSLNVISRMVLGKKYLEKKSQNGILSPEEFKKMLDELFLLNGVLNIGDFIPWINFMDLQGYIKRMKAVSKKFDRFMEHVLDEHNERRRGNPDYGAQDMVDVLLQLADDPTLDVKFERHGIKAFTQDLIAGGTESSAVTVEWVMSELLRKPEIFKKATEELDRVTGRERWVEEKDIPNLAYINAIAKETMRLHPVAPMLAPRLARDDVKVTAGGYDIPKGTQVLINIWTIGRDPAIWQNPNDFEPERFLLGKNIDVKGHDYELLPFGAGRRMCPGFPLGLKMILVNLANMLHGFHWRLKDGMKEEDLSMEEIFGLSTPKKLPLEAVVHPRLAAHLY